MRSLIQQVTRLRADLDTLQRHVYSGAPPPATAAQPPAPGAEAAQSQSARLQLRINELEGEIRQLTGQIEEVAFKLDRVGRRLDKLVEDVDFRLAALERQGQGTATVGGEAGGSQVLSSVAGTPGAPPPPLGGEQASTLAAAPEGVGQETTAPPGTLGTVTASDLATMREGAPAAPPPGAADVAPAATATAPGPVASVAPTATDALPAGPPGEQYEYAKTLLGQGEWELAERAFQAFLERNPRDRFAANAHYWLGETYYVRKDYKAAAEAFLVGYRTFPKSPKAPDSLLKLGMSLAQLGETKEACTTLAAVREQFATSSETVVRVAERERNRLGCG